MCEEELSVAKWMLFRSSEDEPVHVWEYIDDVNEAKKYWYVADAIRKYGVESVMPIVMNANGGYHTHRPDAEDVVAIIESVNEPSLSLFEKYPVNCKGFRTGWVSPDCTTFQCDYMGHIGLAMKIAEEMLGLPNHVTADDLLLDAGWIKVADKQWMGHHGKYNNKQIEFLSKMGIVPKFDYLLWRGNENADGC